MKFTLEMLSTYRRKKAEVLEAGHDNDGKHGLKLVGFRFGTGVVSCNAFVPGCTWNFVRNSTQDCQGACARRSRQGSADEARGRSRRMKV